MNELPELTTAWREVLGRAATDFGATVVGFLPNLVAALLILAAGWLVSRLVELAAGRGLRVLGLDRVAARVRIAEVLDQAGVHLAASQVVAKLIFWLLMLTFVISSVETLGLTAVTATLDRLVAFLPSLVGATLVLLLGLLAARFAATLVSSTAAAAGLPSAPRLGFLAQMAVAGLVVVLAVEQLGVATQVLVAPLTAAVAAAALSAGLAFALGARPIVTHILAGHFLKQSLPRDVFVEIAGQRGVVERVGATDTVLRDGDRIWSVPNAQLLEDVVVRP